MAALLAVWMAFSAGAAPPSRAYVCTLAEARARLAWAKGDKKEAAAQWRKVLKQREHELSVVKEILKRCNQPPDHPNIWADEWKVAEARAHLAVAEGNKKAAAAQWRKMLKYQEHQLFVGKKVRRMCVMSTDCPEIWLEEKKVAAVKADLAEAEGNVTALVAELDRMIEACRKLLPVRRELQRLGVGTVEEVAKLKKEIVDLRKRREAASKQRPTRP